MKIFLKFPGGELRLEREPMPKEQFESICWLVGIFIAGSGVVKVLELMLKA